MMGEPSRYTHVLHVSDRLRVLPVVTELISVGADPNYGLVRIFLHFSSIFLYFPRFSGCLSPRVDWLRTFCDSFGRV